MQNPKESLNEILKNPQMNPNSFSLLSPVCILNETLKDPRWNLKKP